MIRIFVLLSVCLMIVNVAQAESETLEPIFNGEDLTGWTNTAGWEADDGVLKVVEAGQNIQTEEQFEHFELHLDFNLPEGGNSGVYIRRGGLEIQLLDDFADKHANLRDWQYNGSLYGLVAPAEQVSKQPGQWQNMIIRLQGQQLTITLNGTEIIDTNLGDHQDPENPRPGLEPGPGHIGMQNYGGDRVQFRNIRLRRLSE